MGVEGVEDDEEKREKGEPTGKGGGVETESGVPVTPRGNPARAKVTVRAVLGIIIVRGWESGAFFAMNFVLGVGTSLVEGLVFLYFIQVGRG